MGEVVSERLIDQRLRNRVIEAVEWLSDGVDDHGASEYINQFYDQLGVDDRPRPNTAFSDEEFTALHQLCDLMDKVCTTTPRNLKDSGLARWEVPVRQEARHVLDIFLKRGRFSEVVESAFPAVDKS